MPIIRIQSLAGVPIVCDRDPASNYGVGGYRIRPNIDEAFAQKAERAFAEMFQGIAAAGLGDVTAILTGGIARTGIGNSYHHQKRVFDLDGLVLSTGQIWVANSFPVRRFEYLQIEAHLRCHFGTVLNFQYDPAHQDHIRFDDGDSVGFQRHSKSRVVFLQNAISFLFDRPIAVDGIYGPETQQAERFVRADLQIGTLTKKANWIAFLSAAIEEAQDRLSYPELEGLGARIVPERPNEEGVENIQYCVGPTISAC